MPQFRDVTFLTELFARYQRSEQALVLAMINMVIGGVSTRKIAQITEDLCGKEFSKSIFWDLCKQLDPAVQAWHGRRLDQTGYLFLLVDALSTKVREEGHVRSIAILLATGINAAGQRETLGIQLGDSESTGWPGAAQTRTTFFAWLKQRGLQGVDLVVSDTMAAWSLP